MKRVIQMPFTGNPYLLHLWVTLYQRWESEVDKVIVLINGDNMDDNVRYYCESLLEAYGIQYIYSRTRINHGPAIDIMLAALRDAEYVGLVEEDGLIFKSGQVDYCFKILESEKYDVVAGRRGSCSQWLIDLGKQLWDTEDHGPNFWPNFFFSRTNTLLQTDREFGAKTWLANHCVEPLKIPLKKEPSLIINGFYLGNNSQLPYRNLYCKDDTVGDTFVNTSLQLRAVIPPKRIMLLAQYHCVPADLEDYQKQDQVFDGKCPWIHVGSLSSWYSLLMENTLPPDPGCAPAEWERRVAFFELVRRVFVENGSPKHFEAELLDFDTAYKGGINRMIDQYHLDNQAVEARIDIYRELMNV